LLLMIVALVVAPLLVAGCTSTSNPSPSPSPATVNVTTTSATSSVSQTARTSTTSPSASPGAQTITISSSFFFQPSALTIQGGASVTWRNDASVAHQIVSNTGAFSSSVLNPGDSYTHQFSQPGTYAYHCGIHPFMTGTITVQ
jgi:plastocyanin